MSESTLEAQTPRPGPKPSSHLFLKLLFVSLQYAVVIVLPFTFLIYLFIRGTPLVFKKTTENPQYTIVVVTVVSSLWTWLAKQLFSTVVEWFAAVKLGDEMKKSDVVFFAALKTGTALVKKNRRLQTLITWLAVAVLALLSAGYTTLLVPLPVTFLRTTQGWEPDFLAQDSECPSWFQSHYANVSTSICGWETIDGIDVSTCPTDNFNDLLASALNGLTNDPEDGVLVPASPTILWGIGAVPFANGTGGVIPQGPGSEPFVDTTGLWLNESTRSDISLQGLDTNVTCQSVSTVPITLSSDDFSSTATATVTCPDGSSRQWSLPFSDTGLAAIDCPGSPNVDNSGDNLLYIMTLGSTPPGVPTFGNLSCHITARIVDGKLEQGPDTGEVFEWGPSGVPPNLPPAFDIAGQSVGGLSAALLTGQTETGNDFLGTFQTLFLSIISADADVPTLVSYMLEGVILYEASFIRRLFALSLASETRRDSNVAFQPIPAPNTPCIRNFTLDYSWEESGWQAHSQLFISFVSIGLVGLAVLGMFIWILLRGSKGLNRTDVLDPVVLLGKTAHIVKKEVTKEFAEEEKEIKESALDEIKELRDDDDQEPARKSRRMRNRDWSGITDFFS
ncbi:hypothetical protein SISNIDRAFT_509800 [Sistotremastrum niveocremeum HHB9708]|uniref:Uncharacterized protein n=1 Tax=Sistotremastrum niveocremeum HHB9708 TaxID=1314777 RepID=A0A164TXI5_9AGAM|nr:hypothetical protein SISNIDRAFT_509800 [Sistotremastrum niveocremeum HHB9708]